MTIPTQPISARRSKNPGRRLLALATAIALSAAACGSTSTATDAPELASIEGATETTSTASTDDGAAPADDNSDDKPEGNADGSGDDSAEETEPAAPVDPDQAFAEFEACMSEYGVTVAIGGLGAGGASVDELEPAGDQPFENVTPEDIEAADAACQPILDNAFGSFDLSPEQEAEQADAMLEMQQCLSAAGFDIDMTGNAFELSPDIDFDEFNKAMNDCAPDGAIAAGS